MQRIQWLQDCVDLLCKRFAHPYGWLKKRIRKRPTEFVNFICSILWALLSRLIWCDAKRSQVAIIIFDNTSRDCALYLYFWEASVLRTNRKSMLSQVRVVGTKKFSAMLGQNIFFDKQEARFFFLTSDLVFTNDDNMLTSLTYHHPWEKAAIPL